MKKNAGITLVALVITVIILIILSGVALSMITGNDGIFTKANEAASLYNQKAKEEASFLESLLSSEYFGFKHVDSEKVDKGKYEYKITGWGNSTDPSGNNAKLEITSKVDNGYKIEYSTDGGNTWTEVPAGGIPLSGVNGQNVQIRVIKTDGSNTVVQQDTIKVYSKDTVPPKPFEYTATRNQAGTSVTVIGKTTDGAETADSGKSGIKGYQYRITEENETPGPWKPSTPTTESNYTFNNLDPNKSYIIEVKAVDYAGNETIASNSTQVIKPSQLPVSAGSTSSKPDVLPPKPFEFIVTGIGEDSITVSALTTDADATGNSGSGEVIRYQYKLDDGEWEPNPATTDNTYTFTGLTVGSNHTVSVRAVDEAGNITEATNKDEAIETLTSIPDLVKDSNVTFTYSPSKYVNPSKDGAVQVAISTTETGYTLQYSDDEGANWNTYSGPISASTYNKVILARLADTATNREGGVATANVTNIDILPPKAFSLSATAVETTITVSAASTVEDADVTTTSGKSGIRGYQYKIDGGNWTTEETSASHTFTGLSAESSHTVSMRAIDNAGNITEAANKGTSTSTLAKVPDLVKDSNVTFTYSPSKYVNPSKDGAVQVAISTTETGYTLQYSDDEGANWNTYSGPISASTYNKVILARLVDTATNREGGVATGNVTNIDILAPKAFNLSTTAEETTITVSATSTVEDADATTTSGKSGIRGYQYKLDSGSWTAEKTSATHTFTGLTAGTAHTVSMRAIDNAGNITEAANKDLSISTKEIPKNTGKFDSEAKVNTPDTSKLPKATTKYVTYTGSGTYAPQEVESVPNNWYDYANGQWANMSTNGNGLKAYWVWIPRFAYKLPESSTAKEIDVIFVKDKGKTGVKADGTEVQCYYSTDSEITSNGSGLYANKTSTATGKYIIHPAFTFGGTQLAGIWFAKFEASSSNHSADYGGGNVTNLQVQVKPDVTSWRYIQLANSFTVTRKMQDTGGVIGTTTGTTTIDTHMAKNMEWAAVEILSQSKYGIYNPQSAVKNETNPRVWNNPNSSYTTGTVGTTADAANVADGTCTKYNTGNGPKGSSTGTIYGVYDMAGGSWEYVMGVMSTDNNITETTPNVTVGSSGYTSTSAFTGAIERKYYDVYKTGTWNSYTGRGYIGDMTEELKPTFDSSHGYLWYDECAHFVFSSSPFFVRGGCYVDGARAGAFAFGDNSGGTYAYITFRPVLLVF